MYMLQEKTIFFLILSEQKSEGSETLFYIPYHTIIIYVTIHFLNPAVFFTWILLII